MYKIERDFEQLAKDYTPLIKKTIFLCGLQKAYDDAYQIGLLALWEATVHFCPQKGAFPAYAKATVQGRLKSFKKKEVLYSQRFQVDPLEWEDWLHSSNWDVEIDFDRYELSPRENDWVKESIQDGRSTSEIAQIYAVSENTVRSWKKGVMKKIKQDEKRNVFLTRK